MLLAIAYHANEENQAWPSITTLARETGFTERSVHRAIKQLSDLGELKVSSNAGPGLCNLYRVCVTPDTASPLTQRHPRQDVTPDRMSPLTFTPPTPDIVSPTPDTVSPRTVKEQSENSQGKPSSAPQPTVVPIRPDVDRLCELLADGIQTTTGERPKVNKRWHDACRLLLDRDHYTTEQVEALIVWSQNHEFWRTTILSMPKLRDKRLQLIAQIRRETTNRRRDEPASWAALREL